MAASIQQDKIQVILLVDELNLHAIGHCEGLGAAPQPAAAHLKLECLDERGARLFDVIDFGAAVGASEAALHEALLCQVGLEALHDQEILP